MNEPLVYLSILILIPIFGLIYYYNKGVRLKQLLTEAFSDIDVQLKRRFDLIPSLVTIVTGYAKHETETLTSVTNIRSNSENNNAGLQLKSILAIAENYPNLKADKNFLELQTSLTEIEDYLQSARKYYNGCVRNFNIFYQTFPTNLIAKLFKFQTANFFEIDYATERKNPDVKF